MVVTLEREEDEMNPTVRKISKKWEDQPCHHEESSSQPCNRDAPSFPTLSSRKIQSSGRTYANSAIKKDRCHVLQNHKNKKKEEKNKASSEKFDQTLSSRRKMRRTLPLENSQNKRKKFKPCHQEEHTGYWFWLKGIARWDLRLAQPHTDVGSG